MHFFYVKSNILCKWSNILCKYRAVCGECKSTCNPLQYSTHPIKYLTCYPPAPLIFNVAPPMFYVPHWIFYVPPPNCSNILGTPSNILCNPSNILDIPSNILCNPSNILCKPYLWCLGHPIGTVLAFEEGEVLSWTCDVLPIPCKVQVGAFQVSALSTAPETVWLNRGLKLQSVLDVCHLSCSVHTITGTTQHQQHDTFSPCLGHEVPAEHYLLIPQSPAGLLS